MTQQLENVRCAWITPIFGVDGNLLYFKSILQKFSQRCAELRIFTSEFKGDATDSGLSICQFGKLVRLYKVGRHSRNIQTRYISGINMSFVFPSGFSNLIRWKPNLLIVNEFSMLSFYAAIAKWLIPECKMLLVVECAPRTGGSRLMETARLLYRRLIVRSADAILTNNITGTNYLTGKLKADRKNIVCKPYLVSDLTEQAVPVSKKSTTYKPDRDNPIQFLYVGQLFEQKGVQYALESFAMLEPEYKSRYRFDIVGDGPFRAALEKLAHDMGLVDNVKFHGRRPYETLPAYYQAADIFVFPTLNDYRALVPFEALCFGLPILASIHDGGIVETVSEGNNGFSFNPQNPYELAGRIREILNHPGKLITFSQNSSAMAELFSLSSAIDTIESASISALNSK